MSKRVIDDSLKKMAVELSYACGAVKEVGDELGIDPSRPNKWRNLASSPEQAPVGLTQEQQHSLLFHSDRGVQYTPALSSVNS